MQIIKIYIQKNGALNEHITINNLEYIRCTRFDTLEGKIVWWIYKDDYIKPDEESKMEKIYQFQIVRKKKLNRILNE